MPTPLATLAGFSEVTPGRLDRPFLGLHLESAVAALRDAEMEGSDVDGLICVGSMMGESIEHTFLSEEIQDSLGLHELGLQLGVQLGGGSHLAMLGVATRAIQAGQCSAVLCVSAGVFPPIRDVGRSLMTMTCHPDYELPYAPSIPTLYGLIAQSWLDEVGLGREVFAEAVVAQQEWALAHPTAIGADTGRFTVEQVLDARHIAGPFGYLDCSIPCEGGGAFVVVSPDRAATLPHRPVHVVGIGEGHTHGFLTSMPDLSRTGAVRSGATAFAQAGIAPADIQLAQLYDAFSSNPLMLLEELGLAERGKSVELYRDGATRPRGRLPVNTNGGLLRFGHSGTASGICGVLEAYQQMTGRAAGIQVGQADLAVVHAYGSMLCSHVTVILEGS